MRKQEFTAIGQVARSSIQSSFNVSHNEKLCPVHRVLSDERESLTRYPLQFDFN